jgi:hypothetical protein
MNRHLCLLVTPAAWPFWPFLPLVRLSRGTVEVGVLFDARGCVGRTGYSATVFRTNLFLVPRCLDRLLALPREAFDTADEVVAAGWRVDGGREGDR